MPNIRQLKRRIGTVKNTAKITNALQLVAASKMRRAQDRALQSRPYADKLSFVLAGLATKGSDSEEAAHPLLISRPVENVAVLHITPNRGLCGGLNSNLNRAAGTFVAAQEQPVNLVAVGKKGREQLRRDFAANMVGHVDMSEVKRVGYSNAQAIARDVLARFEAGECDVVTIFYNRFQSVISQIPTEQQIIPAKFEAGAATALYDYEPSEEAILADLLPRGVATQIFTALLENGASEQGARMSAMDNATRNAGEMITKYTTIYNRSRQAAITKELIEIISGAEAL